MNIQIGLKRTALSTVFAVFVAQNVFAAAAATQANAPTIKAPPPVAAAPTATGPAFEAYYKFFLGSKHSGYVIQRFEVIDAKKEMVSTYYCYVQTPTGPTIESLVAHADLNFEPISYQYTALVDGKPKLVDATFKNKIMTATIVEGKKSKTVKLGVKANGFLSTFLNYVILKNGLSVNKNYAFVALSEEDPGFHEGTANVLKEQKVQGIDAYRIEFKYKGINFIGLVTDNGEPLGTLSPEQNASTEMVTGRLEAIGAMPFNDKQIMALFKNIPEGKNNKMVRASKTLNQ